MRIWNLTVARVRAVLRRRQVEDDLAEELRLHVEREVEQHVASGTSPEEARRRALVTFGGVEQIKEDCRDARGVSFVDHLSRDTRHGLRRLVRDWRFTTAAVLILALGIGANTAMFSLVNTALFREKAFADPDRLVEIYQNVGAAAFPGASSYPAYLDMAEHTEVFAGTTAVLIDGVNVQAGAGLRVSVAEYTTASYLSVVGLRTSLGRWFESGEDVPGAAVVAVVGYQAWRTRFGADPSLVGRTIRVNGVPVTIVGVGPEMLNNTLNAGIVTDFWLPISSMPALGAPPRALQRKPEEAAFLVKARLREGISVAQAQAAMDNLGKRLAAEYPNEDPGRGISVLSSRAVRIHPQIDEVLALGATLLLTVVGLVLAIACSNLATLLLVRAASRSKEVSVRLALGATRGQLVRHLLAESLMLSAAGGIAGCVLAWWAVRSLTALSLPILVDVSLDYRVLAFTVALSFVTGVAFGLAPALKATRIDLLPTLREEGPSLSLDRRRFNLKNALVVFQVAVSFLLLTGTSFVLRSLASFQTQDVGFPVRSLAFLETDARYAGYAPDQAQAIYEKLRQRIATIPGVESAILTRDAPTSSKESLLVIEGAEASSSPAVVLIPWIWAGPGYFETLRIPVLSGRTFNDRDRAGSPRVVVVTESMARRYFDTVNAVGRRLRFEADPASWMEVVGVVRDTIPELTEGSRPFFYRPFLQADRPATMVVARTSLDASTLVAAMQRELRDLDIGLPVIAATTMEEYMEESLVVAKGASVFLGGLGLLGLALASVGLYAVVAFAVSRRSLEVGIRMALGAQRSQVTWLIGRDVATLMSVALALGAGLSLLALQALKLIDVSAPNITIETPTADSVALLPIALLMATVALAAAYFPARRAAMADPLVALRHH